MLNLFIDLILNFFNKNHIVLENGFLNLLNLFLLNLEFFSNFVNKVFKNWLYLDVHSLQKFGYKKILFVFSLIFEPESRKLEFYDSLI
jgi:hypothetical protein